ncbi:MAG: hypothetical protein QXY98_00770 [Thermoplasmata archaeon]
MQSKAKSAEQEKFLLEKYASDRQEPFERFLRQVLKFLRDSKSSDKDRKTVLMEALQTIQSFTKFKECTIGYRDPDGLYRFKAMVGFKEEAMKARQEIAYTSDDMMDIASYRPVTICRFAFLHLSERKPYKSGMENTYNKPELLNMPRKYPDDMIEGDYLEILIRGKGQEIIGWIELSGTSDGKLPSREEVLKAEFFSSCLIPVLERIMK